MLSAVLGFAALVLIFRFKSFREVIAHGREHRRQESGVVVEGEADVPVAG